jgi:CheY-like chemotaxis protein
MLACHASKDGWIGTGEHDGVRFERRHEEDRRAMRVLIAEDDAVSRRILQRAVERFGHQCQAAIAGAEAWQGYQDAPYDVVITDWVMPHLDGVALCELIRDNPGPCYTYVILL